MNRLKFEMVVLAVLLGIFLGRIPDTLGKSDPYRFFDTLIDLRTELGRHYVEEPDQEKMREGAIAGMIEALGDPYTDYFSPTDLEAFDKSTRGTFSGIGAEIDQEGEEIVIVSPLDGSPAHKAGILAGDVILEINGKSAEGLTTAEAVEQITGPEGTEVSLKVRHADGETEIIKITRGRIQIQTVKGFDRDKEHHWNYMLDSQAGIAYIRLTQFSEPSADALREAIETAKKADMKGLILDLRFNPGGLLDQAVDISDMFLTKGKIVSTRGRNSPERSWEASDSGDVGDFPMVILINEYSASASEILAGALRDNERATIVGTRSFGKGSVQQVLALESGEGAVKVTTAYYYLPSGRNLHRKEDAETWGVDPTDGFYVPMTFDQMKKMGDLRREADVINDGNGKRPERVTPDWLREERSDLQLAAGLQAMLTYLETGKWEPIGQPNSTLLAHMTEKAALEKRRDTLNESIAEINKKLEELDKTIAKVGAKDEAPGADAAAPEGEKKPEGNEQK